MILWRFRADLKDYAFFFSLSVDRRKKERGEGAEKKTEEKRSMAKETGNSSPAPSFPLFSITF